MPKELIVCLNTDPAKAEFAGACDFNSLILLSQNLITDLIFLSTLFATAAFAYAGFKLLTSRGNEKAADEAKEIFTKVGWGYLWLLVAWLLVYTITSLLAPGFSLLGAPRLL